MEKKVKHEIKLLKERVEKGREVNLSSFKMNYLSKRQCCICGRRIKVADEYRDMHVIYTNEFTYICKRCSKKILEDFDLKSYIVERLFVVEEEAIFGDIST